MTIMHTSNAERMYYERNPKAKKERESLENKNCRLSRMYNNCSCVISEIKNRTDYKKAQELINSYADETDSQLDIYRLNKLLSEKIASLLQQNDENMKKIQKEIDDIKSIRVEESTEKLQKLEYESNNILYSMMAKLHNGINENSDRRRVGNWCKNPSRQESIALQKLYALPQYQKLFTAHQKEVIVANGRNPEEVAHEQAMQPVLQEKNSQLAKTYLNGFGLRNIQAQMSNKLTALEKDGEN